MFWNLVVGWNLFRKIDWTFATRISNLKENEQKEEKSAIKEIIIQFQWDFSREGETNLNKRKISFPWNNYELSFERWNIFLLSRFSLQITISIIYIKAIIIITIIIIIDEDNNNETHIFSNVTQDIRNINIYGEEIKKLFINCN